ncbi:pentapeptide repeat-containing protein [Hyphomicrobium methylovorum]|uniref:pentapeptide repeat-containing protein n=1 Tax=Hyphomicrobium methylovorum TaxID=84 RepID=UPI0015E7D8E5|nr:pentapeptide repeat-containing protein [Hyphomicrobium methylovorum]MBA2125726.1 pentapeptide repeat-containing protein [Hyphomicrobium methylovorum]
MLAIAMGCLAAANVSAAEMTARDVTRLLFAATSDKQPDLTNRNLAGLDLAGLDFKRAKLDGANLYGADLSGSNLSGASLRSARLDRATLIGTDFSAADLSGASLLRPNVFESMDGPAGHRTLTFAGARLVGANLNGRFDGVNFSGADLTSAVFGPRDPREEVLISPMMSLAAANFSGAVLADANLSGNSLENAKFNGANLTHADLTRTRLGGADFTGANIDDADLTGAEIHPRTLHGAHGVASAKGISAAR